MRALLVLAISLMAGNAWAQTPDPGQVDRALGAWELSNPSGTRKCGVTFRPDRLGRGLALTLEPACQQTFPALAGITGWTVAPNGNILWLDREGLAQFDFGETEVGIFEAIRPGDATVYFLTNLGLAGTIPPSIEEVTGPWTIGQPRGRPLCRLTLRPELAADAGPLEQRFALDVGPGCERSVAALGLASWRLDRELLLLIGTGRQSVSFRREPGGRWLKVPPDNRPLTMTRD